jgi:hypothetical protein
MNGHKVYKHKCPVSWSRDTRSKLQQPRLFKYTDFSTIDTMYLSHVFLHLTGFLASAIALPSTTLPRQSTPSFGPTWNVTNFDGGCSPGGCILTLNISYVPPSTSTLEPPFSGYCLVNGDDDFFQPCTVQTGEGSLLAKSLPGTEVFSVEIIHEYVVAATHWFNVSPRPLF